ncbi:MAG TPA: nucleotidyltransferase [Planctomycetota bacterium]|nr:nucleotidyltransferase [Planctomycetota bacterium]
MLQIEKLLIALDRARVDYVVIGGVAAIVQGASYITADLDICYRRSPGNYQRISDALRPFKPRLRGVPPGLPFKLDPATIKAGLNFTLETDQGDIDLLGELSGLGDYDSVKACAVEAEVYGENMWVLTLEGLIAAKQAAGRAKDLRLLPELRALQALRAKEKDGS